MKLPRRIKPGLYKVCESPYGGGVMGGATFVRAALVAAAVATNAPLPARAANDKAMNWCGWRTNTTFTTASPHVAKNLRDLDTFRNWFATDNPHGNDAG